MWAKSYRFEKAAEQPISCRRSRTESHASPVVAYGAQMRIKQHFRSSRLNHCVRKTPVGVSEDDILKAERCSVVQTRAAVRQLASQGSLTHLLWEHPKKTPLPNRCPTESKQSPKQATGNLSAYESDVINLSGWTRLIIINLPERIVHRKRNAFPTSTHLIPHA